MIILVFIIILKQINISIFFNNFFKKYIILYNYYKIKLFFFFNCIMGINMEFFLFPNNLNLFISKSKSNTKEINNKIFIK